MLLRWTQSEDVTPRLLYFDHFPACVQKGRTLYKKFNCSTIGRAIPFSAMTVGGSISREGAMRTGKEATWI